MSAPRPRPVTATINHSSKRNKLKSIYRAESKLSYSSSGSTESLVSCIENYSLDSDSGAEKENNRFEKRNHGSDTQASYSETLTKTSEPSHVTHTASQSVARTTTTKSSDDQVSNQPDLGAWEKWMMRKTELLKIASLKQAEMVKSKKEADKLSKMEQEERKKRASKMREDWLEKKNEEQKKAEKRQQLRQLRKQKEEQQKREEIEEKAHAKFQEWLEEKKRSDARKKELEAKRDKEREDELKEKKARSDEAFQAWLQKASSRQIVSNQRSYAKCDGVLNGYYDKAACSSPSYYNPIPWQPVALLPEPKVKSKKARRKGPRNAWSVDN